MKKLLLTTLVLFGSISTAMASTISEVDSQSCAQLKGTTAPFILVLKKGENLSDGILQCANDADLPSATLTGLGALEDTTLTYFDHVKKTYKEKKFPQFLELLALNGNVTTLDGKRTTHLHVALSDNHYKMMGGHVGSAYIGATAEINVTPLPGKLVRKMDEKTGLELITNG